MQDLDTSTPAVKPTLPFSPLTEEGLAIQLNQRAAALTYIAPNGWTRETALEASRVYDMAVAHSNRVLATLLAVA